MKDLLALIDKHRIFVIPVLMGLSSLVLITLVILPQISGYLKGQGDLQESKEKQKLLEVKAQQLESLDEDSLNQKLTLANSSLPTDKEVTAAISVIQQVAAASNTILSSLQLGQVATVKQGAASGFNLRAELTGPTQTFEDLLKSVETSSRVMKVNSIEVTSSRTDGSQTALLSIDVYYAAAPQAAPKVDAALPQITAEEEELIVRLSSGVQAPTPGSSFTLTPRGKANPFE